MEQDIARLNDDPEHADVCARCGGARGQHEHGECSCRHAIVRAYWAPLENLPPYMETRENVLAWERDAPLPCSCRHFAEASPIDGAQANGTAA